MVLFRKHEALGLWESGWLGATCFAALVLWTRAIRDWNRIRQALCNEELREGTPLWLALEVAGAHIMQGLQFLLLISAGLLGVIGAVAK
jgi:hypothetical protein